MVEPPTHVQPEDPESEDRHSVESGSGQGLYGDLKLVVSVFRGRKISVSGGRLKRKGN